MKEKKVVFEDNTDEMLEEELEYAKTLDISTNGKAIIEIEVKNADNFFSPYSVKGDEVMNSELNAFILESENNIPLKKELKVNIYVDDEHKVHSAKIKKTFQRNFADKLASCDTWLKNNLSKSILFLIIGMILFTASIFAHIYNCHIAIYSILDIVCWIFMWEGIAQITIYRSEKKIEQKHLLRLLNAEISVRKKAY